MITTETQVLIIGAGISGLATAWWLNRAGISTVVLEKSERVGGKIQTVTNGNYRMENAASMVMNFRPEVNQFIQDAGLDRLKIHRNALAEEQRYLLHQGQLTTVPSKLGRIPFSSIWSLKGKLRMAMEPLIPKGGNSEESVAQFIRRRLGNELLESAMEPFVAGTLASDPEKANAYSVLPKLTALEQQYGGILKGIMRKKISGVKSAMISDVFSFQGGMQSLTNRLADTLHLNNNASIHTQHSVTTIEPDGKGWQVCAQSPNGEQQFQCQHIVCSLPSYAASSILKPLDSALANLLGGIDYAALSLVHLGFDRSTISHPLNGTGFLIPKREGLHITGNLWMSSIFQDRAAENKTLLTSYLGGACLPEAINWDDSKIVASVMKDIRSALKINADPEMVTIKRHQQALPLYHGHYFQRCQAIARQLAEHPGLHIEANYIGGVSVRDRLCHSKQTAEKILRQLSSMHSPEKETTKTESNTLALNNLKPTPM